ncbi:hypothetical protein L7F22_056596 [Adiantum nelumboides]|nr:hypothetical protein [Adiantum nelumboides]
MDPTEVFEDLKALEWLEFGRVLVAPQCDSIVGMQTEEHLTSACCPKLLDRSLSSRVALSSGNDLHYSTHGGINLCLEAAPAEECDQRYSTHGGFSLCSEVATAEECSNVTEVPGFMDNYNGQKHAESLPSYSTLTVSRECESSSGFSSIVPCACTSPDEIQRKALCARQDMTTELEPLQLTASATRCEAEQTLQPSTAQVNKGAPVAQVKYVGRVLDVTSQESQPVLSSIMQPQLPVRQERALICSSEDASAPRKLCRDEPASHMSQPAYLKNLNTTETGKVTANTMSSPIANMAANHEVIEKSHFQNLNRKEMGNVTANLQSPSVASMLAELPRFQHYVQPGIAEKEDGKELQPKETAICKSSTYLEVISDTEMESAANFSCTSQPSLAKKVTSSDVGTVSLMTANATEHNGCQMSNSSLLTQGASHEAERAAAPRLATFDAASAGFLDVLNDAASSSTLMDSNEDSLNLLERWRKRRHSCQFSEMTAKKASKVPRM